MGSMAGNHGLLDRPRREEILMSQWVAWMELTDCSTARGGRKSGGPMGSKDSLNILQESGHGQVLPCSGMLKA